MQDLEEPSTAVGAPSEGLEYADLLGRLERTVRRICPPWLSASRDDLVQASVVKVMDLTRSREQSGGLSSSYLWRVAHSVMIDEIRRARRRGEVTLEETDEPGSPRVSPVSESADPDRELSSKELGRELWDCLGGLVEARRRVVALHLGGSTPAEAARMLGWNAKKVYNLIHRGMNDLRDCLRAKGLEP